MYVCLYTEIETYLAFCFKNGKHVFQLAKIDVQSSLNLLGKEGKRVLQWTLIEMADVIVHL